ncbi:MAG: nucleotidyl transferase AbiEii/AbiGii toxin family protein, partial [Armatimonadetes bacterium]|nr:nucleotidyl transferase AbiEii/AbiGii toxin family protein [Armatimonadota bacterium]
MIEHLRQLVQRTDGAAMRSLIAREYLQARILEALQDQGVFACWAFGGGTAARFVHGLPRFSEDLDFSEVRSHVAIGAATERIVQRLERESYDVDARVKEDRAVASASLRFRGLPYALGLSPHRDQALTIKIEVDTNPPEGAMTTITVVRRHVLLRLCHHDRASLLAGKINAILTRPWTKGRDLYDLVWYIADRTWPEPELPFLAASLKQVGWNGPDLRPDNWRSVLSRRLAELDWG